MNYMCVFISVAIYQGASKDIQQLFTAIDRRIEALLRNTKNNSTDDRDKLPESTSDQPLPQFEDDDKESFTLGEHNSSPESSPDCHVGSRTRHAPAIVSKPDKKNDANDDQCARGLNEKMSDKASNADKVNASKTSASCATTEECSGESEKESETATPASSRSPSEGASTTTTISSSTDNANEASFSQ